MYNFLLYYDVQYFSVFRPFLRRAKNSCKDDVKGGRVVASAPLDELPAVNPLHFWSVSYLPELRNEICMLQAAGIASFSVRQAFHYRIFITTFRLAYECFPVGRVWVRIECARTGWCMWLEFHPMLCDQFGGSSTRAKALAVDEFRFRLCKGDSDRSSCPSANELTPHRLFSCVEQISRIRQWSSWLEQ